MMMREYVILVAGIMVVTGTPVNAAAPAGEKFDLFRIIDQNNDNVIVMEEAQSNAGLYFDQIDKNGDGTMTIEELRGRATDVEKLRNPDTATLENRAAERAARQFSAIDTNGDGKVTRDEYTGRATERFQTRDTDHDGRVTREEFKKRPVMQDNATESVTDAQLPNTEPPQSGFLDFTPPKK
jgi:Ca2+-binding EF-hand superfamily protein